MWLARLRPENLTEKKSKGFYFSFFYVRHVLSVTPCCYVVKYCRSAGTFAQCTMLLARRRAFGQPAGLVGLGVAVAFSSGRGQCLGVHWQRQF